MNLFLFSSCTETPLEKALKQAGDNRIELEKVLDYYGKEAKDPLKLLAARFLIENMDVHYSFQSKELDTYYSLLDSVFKLTSPDAPITQEQDSLLSALSLPAMQGVSLLPDLQTLSASFLIENIEQAFEAWNSPFAQHLSFEDFCEYLLPYRVRYEQAMPWRSEYNTIFSTHLQTYNDTTLQLNNGLVIQDKWNLYSLPEENKYKTIPADLLSDVSQLTVCGWINPDANRTFARFFDFGRGDSCYICFIPYDEAEKSSLRVLAKGSREERVTADALPVNRWSHVAVSFTDHNLSLYINGQLISSKDTQIDLKEFVCNYIGKSQYPIDPYLEGSIEKFEIYNTILTGEEIKVLASHRQSGLSSSHTLLLQTDFKNLPGKAEYHSLGEDLFSDMDQFTVSGWIKPDQDERFSRFFDFGKDQSCYIAFMPYDYFHKGCLLIKTDHDQEQQLGAEALPVNEWSHILVSFSGTRVNLYINGKIAGSRSVAIDIKSFKNNYIGKSKYDYDPNFKGSIDDFRLYNRELTYTEIVELAGKSPLTPRENLQAIVEKLRTYYHRQLLLSQGLITGGYSPSLLLNIKKGSCNDYSVLSTHIFRSLGIPSAIDFSLQAGHDWNVLFFDKNSYDCSFIDNDTLGTHVELYQKILPDRIAKIFRHTYAKQPDTPVMSGIEESFPESFKTPCIKDVSDLYLPTTDVSVTLDKKPPQDQKFVYLCFFLREWFPVHWSKHQSGKALFTKMGKGVIYLPVYYHNNQTYPAAYPFALTLEGETRILKPDTTHTQSLTLIRKYPEKLVHQNDRLLGATFQMAGKEDFSDALTIHTIDKRPEIRYNEVALSLNKKYRYFRFMAPPKSNGGEICEIDLFDKEGQKIKPYKIIGNDASPPDRNPESVFDGNPLSSYWCDQADEGWVGIDFGKPVDIGSFRFLPLNDDNFIRENELYELFYWDEEWISLGRQTGTSSQYLEYRNAPTNALFLLRNLTKGKEERIFTYEDNKQVWW